jgi:hypothetical protein
VKRTGRAAHGPGIRRAAGGVRRRYGASPLHLLALLAAFALAGYAVHAVVAAGQWRGFAVWFIVAIVGHDIFLFPLYSLADLSVRRLLPRWAVEGPGSGLTHLPAGPPVINYLRIPVGFSLLLLLVWFPLILGLSSAAYYRASGLSTSPYLWRWLAITGAMFAVSAMAYALAMRRASGRARAAETARAGQRLP